MTDEWSLKGKGITCCGSPSQIIEVTGMHTLYDDKIIKILCQKLIEDVTDIFYHTIYFDYGYPEAIKHAKKVINNRFGVE